MAKALATESQMNFLAGFVLFYKGSIISLVPHFIIAGGSSDSGNSGSCCEAILVVVVV